MSETIADLQKAVADQGQLIQQEHEEVHAILDEQAQAIADLEEKLAAIPGAAAAVEAEVQKIKDHNTQIAGIVEPEVNPTPPTDPNAPKPDQSLPGPQPKPDQTLPGNLPPQPTQLPAAKK